MDPVVGLVLCVAVIALVIENVLARRSGERERDKARISSDEERARFEHTVIELARISKASSVKDLAEMKAAEAPAVFSGVGRSDADEAAIEHDVQEVASVDQIFEKASTADGQVNPRRRRFSRTEEPSEE